MKIIWLLLKFYFSKEKRYIRQPTKEFDVYIQEHKAIAELQKKGQWDHLSHKRPTKFIGEIYKWVPDLYDTVKGQKLVFYSEISQHEKMFHKDFVPCKSPLLKSDAKAYRQNFRNELKAAIAKYKDA